MPEGGDVVAVGVRFSQRRQESNRKYAVRVLRIGSGTNRAAHELIVILWLRGSTGRVLLYCELYGMLCLWMECVVIYIYILVTSNIFMLYFCVLNRPGWPAWVSVLEKMYG